MAAINRKCTQLQYRIRFRERIRLIPGLPIKYIKWKVKSQKYRIPRNRPPQLINNDRSLSLASTGPSSGKCPTMVRISSRVKFQFSLIKSVLKHEKAFKDLAVTRSLLNLTARQVIPLVYWDPISLTARNVCIHTHSYLFFDAKKDKCPAGIRWPNFGRRVKK